MIPCSSTLRRGSILTQLDFDDILTLERTELTSHIFPTRGNIFDHNSNLQVVPDLVECSSRHDTTGLERELTGLHFTWPRITVMEAQDTGSCNAPRISAERIETECYPRSPFLPRTSISEIDNMGILSPLFSISNTNSPLLKTPSTLYEICCSSRKSSDDLSIYLPENFTPASLECLDKSVNRTVFQFPATEPKLEDTVFVENKINKEVTSTDFTLKHLHLQEDNDTKNAENSSIIQDAPNKNPTEVKPLIDISSVKEKRAKKKRAKQQSGFQNFKRRKSCDTELQTNCTDVSSIEKLEPSPLLRNQMERERRNDLNNRFKKLRECLPEDAAKINTSKIAILRAATAYTNELICQETLLENVSIVEKNRNEELLKKLVSISETLSETK